MSRAVRNSPKRPVPAPTATYKVRFGGRNGNTARDGNVGSPGRIPRVTRLLALAHRIDGRIRAGELNDWAEAARLVGVTRARMTQISNLLLLAPGIQEVILDLPPIVEDQDSVAEHNLRSIMSHCEWSYQISLWERLRPFSARLPQFHSHIKFPGCHSAGRGDQFIECAQQPLPDIDSPIC